MSLSKELRNLTDNNFDDTNINDKFNLIINRAKYHAKNGENRYIIGTLDGLTSEEKLKLKNKLIEEGFTLTSETIYGNRYYNTHIRFILTW